MGRRAPARTASFSAADARGLGALGRALGTSLARALGHNSHLLVGLDGELGAGKTTLAAATLSAMGVQSTVTSPTYGLVHPYRARPRETGAAIEILHVDLYRLTHPAELDELGLEEHLQAESAAARRVMLVEWFESAGGRLGTPDLSVRLEYARAGREVELHAHSEAGEEVLRILGDSEPACGRLGPGL